jgi:hypothetical protein
MVEKELLIGVLAYNLVRAVMWLAAQRAGIQADRISFTYACNAVIDGCPNILAARGRHQQEKELDRILETVAQYKLPKRRKPRSYPRAVWGHGFPYPRRPQN